ncbi:MAG: hypothetical protein AAFY64_08790 [Pseudomonadota bacterium]
MDIISAGRQIIGWPNSATEWRLLSIPHPRAHKRAFVLAPLAYDAPAWRHPISGRTARALLNTLPYRERRGVRLASPGEV